MLVSDLEDRISRSEFQEWRAYESVELERHDKMDYYLAQIAMNALLPHMKKGASAKINDFLIEFGPAVKKVLSPKRFRDAVCGWFGVAPPEGEKDVK